MARALEALASSLLVLALLPAAAHADPPSNADAAATAQALYDAARERMDRGLFDEACPKLEEALRLLPSAVGAKLRLAECYEGQGRLASAWAMYVAAETAAKAAGQADRERAARERGSAIEARRSRLTIVVPPAMRGLEGLGIERDGVPVGPGQWGEAIPIDGGAHQVIVRAPGKARWEATLTVPRERGEERLTVGPLLDLPALAPLVPAAPAPRIAPAIAPARPPRRTPTWVWITGASGLALGAVGAAFGADCAVLGGKQADLCGPDLDHCERARPSYDPTSDNARRARDYALSLGFSLTGAALLATSIGGLVAHARGAARAPITASPWVSRDAAGAALGGRF